jgi:hypothetical protein
MIIAMNTLYAAPSGALAVLQNFNRQDVVHRLLASLNLFTIWQMVVVGIGLAKFSAKPSGTGIGVAMGLWILWVLISVFLLGGLGM